MTDVPDMTIAALRKRVEQLVSDSEHLFLSFGNIFPLFVKELKQCLQDSRSSLDSLGAGMSIDDAMGNVFAETRATIQSASVNFTEMHKRDDILLQSLNKAIVTLGQLDSVINKVRQDSEEMELISLNAMTVALKSGSAGKAFSVITEELKRLSTRTIQLTDQLINNGHVLLNYFTDYRSEVEKLEETQEKLFNGLEEKVHHSFSRLERYLGTIGSTLKEMVQDSAAVVNPVQQIMETVQLQDILRQSSDHILMALDEIEKAGETSDVDSVEYLVFVIQLVSLSESILQDVRGQLEKSLQRFQSESALIRKVVSKGEKDRRGLMERHFSSGSSEHIISAFEDTTGILQDIKSQVDIYMGLKRSITQNGIRLSESVQGLDRRFRSFDKIINRFRTIDIASRIEISKQSVLRSIRDTVSEMTNLIERISADVGSALSVTQSFIGEIKESIQVYSTTLKVENRLIDDAETSLSTSHRQLQEFGDSIRSGVLGFSLFSDTFLNLLQKGSEQMHGLERIVRECGSIVPDLAEFKRSAEQKLAAAGHDSNNVELHSQQLRDIVGKFTIYAHKRTAADIGGFKVDSEGLDISEQIEADTITFF